MRCNSYTTWRVCVVTQLSIKIWTGVNTVKRKTKAIQFRSYVFWLLCLTKLTFESSRLQFHRLRFQLGTERLNQLFGSNEVIWVGPNLIWLLDTQRRIRAARHKGLLTGWRCNRKVAICKSGRQALETTKPEGLFILNFYPLSQEQITDCCLHILTNLYSVTVAPINQYKNGFLKEIYL